MADIMASHGATAIGRPVSTPVVFKRLIGWHGDWLQRRRLRSLDAHMRRDLGFADSSAARAAARPGWDISLPGLR
jgi:hypothetical protein